MNNPKTTMTDLLRFLSPLAGGGNVNLWRGLAVATDNQAGMMAITAIPDEIMDLGMDQVGSEQEAHATPWALFSRVPWGRVQSIRSGDNGLHVTLDGDDRVRLPVIPVPMYETPQELLGQDLEWRDAPGLIQAMSFCRGVAADSRTSDPMSQAAAVHLVGDRVYGANMGASAIAQAHVGLDLPQASVATAHVAYLERAVGDEVQIAVSGELTLSTSDGRELRGPQFVWIREPGVGLYRCAASTVNAVPFQTIGQAIFAAPGVDMVFPPEVSWWVRTVELWAQQGVGFPVAMITIRDGRIFVSPSTGGGDILGSVPCGQVRQEMQFMVSCELWPRVKGPLQARIDGRENSPLIFTIDGDRRLAVAKVVRRQHPAEGNS